MEHLLNLLKMRNEDDPLFNFSQSFLFFPEKWSLHFHVCTQIVVYTTFPSELCPKFKYWSEYTFIL